MRKVFIINGHQPYPFSPGKLNAELVSRIESNLREKGYDIKHTVSAGDYNVVEEVHKHQWADVVIVQCPVNWMGVPWSLKKYMDEVYSGGIGGQLSNGDGRSREGDPKRNYGAGGVLHGKRYMLSLTFNAPKEAFNDPTEYLFQGKSVDDLFFPYHMNFRFFAMQALPTFACFDVMKNPNIDGDFNRLEIHLDRHFPVI